MIGDGAMSDMYHEPAAVNGATLRDQAAKLRGQAGGKLRGVAEDGKAQVANSLDGLVTAAREIADKLSGGEYGPIGGYASTVADTLGGWTAAVRDGDIEQWMTQGRDLVRRQPAVAVGIAVAAGFLLSRLFKASGTPATPPYRYDA